MLVFIKTMLLGSPGILAVVLTVTPPEGVPAALLAVNPLILLVMAALIGGWAARKLDLRSALILSSAVSARPLLALAATGVLCGIGVSVLDDWSSALWNPGTAQTLRERDPLQNAAVSLLYGGITEEIIFRWGLLSALAVAASHVVSRGVAMSIGTVLAALIFAVAHLPIVALEAGVLTPALAVRTVVWNALLGLLFGAAFVRRGLEAAIAAHLGFHIGLALASQA